MVDGINNIFKTGQKIELKDRGAKGSGITFELKSVFDDLAKQGIIKDKDGKGLTKQDALNLYNMLNKIHQDTNRATNYTTMQVGQSFDYSADELKALAEAAGYELVGPPEEEGAPSNPDALDPSKDKPAGLPTETSISDEPLDKPQGNQRAQTEAMIDTLGGKIIQRSVDGQKQDIAVVEIDGQTVRREINDDGTLGDNLAATKTFGKNEYISGDFPPETKILEREVNGQKQQIGIYEDENGNKMRRLVEQDPNTGEYRLGDNLVAISTAGKNKYITQTEMDNRMRQVLGLADNEPIPEDIKGEFVSIGGEPTLVFKQDGKVMDNAQLKEYIKGLQEQKVEKSDSTQPGESIDTTQGAESSPPQQTTVPEQTTIQDGNSAAKEKYSFENDKLYQKMESALNELEARISQYENNNNRRGVLSMSGDSFLNYRSDKFMYDSLKRDFDSYTEIMTNWQDGTVVPEHTKTRTINGHTVLNVNYTNVETITLKNGERAYKTDQGTFYPFRDGTPGEEKVPEELLP